MTTGPITMEQKIIHRAREIFVERNGVGRVREIAALNGAYDQGTDITQYLQDAERDVLRDMEENIDE